MDEGEEDPARVPVPPPPCRAEDGEAEGESVGWGESVAAPTCGENVGAPAVPLAVPMVGSGVAEAVPPLPAPPPAPRVGVGACDRLEEREGGEVEVGGAGEALSKAEREAEGVPDPVYSELPLGARLAEVLGLGETLGVRVDSGAVAVAPPPSPAPPPPLGLALAVPGTAEPVKSAGEEVAQAEVLRVPACGETLEDGEGRAVGVAEPVELGERAEEAVPPPTRLAVGNALPVAVPVALEAVGA